VFKFKDGPSKNSKGPTDPPQTILQSRLINDKIGKIDRLASPLIIKAVKFQNGKGCSLFLLLKNEWPTNLSLSLISNGKDWLKNENVSELLSPTNFQPRENIEEIELIQYLTDFENPLIAFMEYVKDQLEVK
jgi:CRISPR/Cas system CMR-associated protein Cmr1 (group 7 of RAMP superfamily)